MQGTCHARLIEVPNGGRVVHVGATAIISWLYSHAGGI